MIKKNIPNFITCLNLLCGCIAVSFVYTDDVHIASFLIAIAAVLDFLDGYTARILKVYSPLGKELDSMADMVTFGLIPGIIMFKLIKTAILYHGLKEDISDLLEHFFDLLPYVGLLITIFSALRLAKFNIDTKQTKSFLGLPTPANALMIASFPLIIQYQQIDNDFFLEQMALNPYFLSILTVLMSCLLVLRIPLFSLKFTSLRLKGNETKFILIIGAVVLAVLLKYVSVIFIVGLYILLSLLTRKSILKNEIQS